MDITNFETDLNNFKKNFRRNYNLASQQYLMQLIKLIKLCLVCKKSKMN